LERSRLWTGSRRSATLVTLLESLAALVILGTTAVGFLEVFHSTARATRDARDSARVTAAAESVMEQTKVDERVATELELPADVSAQVERRAWAPGVSEVIVVVTTRDGRRLELRRLTRVDGPAGSAGGPR
jgi:Tfp pilus assembly protein PilV